MPFKFASIIRITATLVVLALFPIVSSAHPGHGAPGTFSHELQHQLWAFAALFALAVTLTRGRKHDSSDE